MKSGRSLAAESEWLSVAALSVAKILTRQGARRFIELTSPSLVRDEAILMLTFGRVRTKGDACLQLWLEPSTADESYDFSFWFASARHATVRSCATAGDASFPRHFVWDHREELVMPPSDAPVLDLRHRGSHYDGNSFYGAWMGQFVPDFHRYLPSLLQTDVAYFFYQTSAVLAGSRGDPTPANYGRTKLRVVRQPSQRHLLSQYACPQCSCRLLSYEQWCERCEWSAIPSLLGRDHAPTFPDELPDT
jgi:hypothetical protein